MNERQSHKITRPQSAHKKYSPMDLFTMKSTQQEYFKNTNVFKTNLSDYTKIRDKLEELKYKYRNA